jgi:putative addiction module CopG family antidote
MTIHLPHELEQLIQKDVERGPYDSVNEFIERAVQMLHDQEEWFAENRAAIAAKIDEGYAAAQRGELLTPDQVREHLEQKKLAWRSNRAQ